MAPQSTTTKGRVGARRPLHDLVGDELLARAALALDEHVDFARRDLLEQREELAHRHAGPREGAERPGSSGTTACPAGATARTTTTESPRASVASVGRSASRMRTLSSFVPLSEPQSRTRQRASSRSRRQWKRETAGSARTRSFEECVPMRQRSPSKSTVRDAGWPPSRATVSERRGMETVSTSWRTVATLVPSRLSRVGGPSGGKNEGGLVTVPGSGGVGSGALGAALFGCDGDGLGMEAGGRGGVGCEGGRGRREFDKQGTDYGIGAQEKGEGARCAFSHLWGGLGAIFDARFGAARAGAWASAFAAGFAAAMGGRPSSARDGGGGRWGAASAGFGEGASACAMGGGALAMGGGGSVAAVAAATESALGAGRAPESDAVGTTKPCMRTPRPIPTPPRSASAATTKSHARETGPSSLGSTDVLCWMREMIGKLTAGGVGVWAEEAGEDGTAGRETVGDLPFFSSRFPVFAGSTSVSCTSFAPVANSRTGGAF